MSETPCEVWFYHLERATLDQILPDLLEKTRARGWRALVRSPMPERLERLDAWLWAWRDDSFLAHGLESEPFAERQPVVLGAGEANPNAAKVLFLIDGAEPGDLAAFERCILIFDGADEAAVAEARSRWTAFKSAGHEVTYWRQGQERGWEKVSA